MKIFLNSMIFVLIVVSFFHLQACGNSNGDGNGSSSDDTSLSDVSESVPDEPPAKELQGTWNLVWIIESDECNLNLTLESIDNIMTVTETDCHLNSNGETQVENDVEVIQECFAGGTIVARDIRISVSDENCESYTWENDFLELDENGYLEGVFEGNIKISGSCLNRFSEERIAQIESGCSFSGTVHGSQAETIFGPTPSDSDADGIPNEDDNCINKKNPDQADSDGDGIGDACEADSDYDNVIDDDDNCEVYNSDQADLDEDGLGDACEPDSDHDQTIDDLDNCPEDYNPDQADSDGDDIGNVCDTPHVTIQPISPEQMADMIADFLDN